MDSLAQKSTQAISRVTELDKQTRYCNSKPTSRSTTGANSVSSLQLRHRTRNGSASWYRWLSGIWESKVPKFLSSASAADEVLYREGSRPRHRNHEVKQKNEINCIPRHSANRERSVPSMGSHNRSIGGRICCER